MSRPQVKKLEVLRQKDFNLGEAMDDLIQAHENTSTALSNDPNGKNIVPPKISGLHVSTGSQSLVVSGGATVQLGGGVHVTITDNSAISRAITYHLEYDTDPGFSNPHYEFLGPGRGKMLSLPNGTYTVRGFSQYAAGGPPSEPVYFPNPVVISNSPFPPLLPSQSSGTGKPFTGGGYGHGKTLTR